MNRFAIEIDRIYKDFRLPHEKHDSLKRWLLSLHRRDRSFEVQHALRDVSLQIERGEFFGIVGRNGSGKSTMLKIIADIYRPTSGRVHRNGKLVPLIELGVGFKPELSGRDNVYLYGSLLGLTDREIESQYDDIVAFAELERFMDQKVKNYSSGMRVRLAFAVATRAKADILLIDEVLAVGDAAFQRKCFEYFRTLKDSDTTVVFISHNMDAVRQFCSRAALIDGSRLVDVGDPQVIADQYAHLFD